MAEETWLRACPYCDHPGVIDHQGVDYEPHYWVRCSNSQCGNEGPSVSKTPAEAADRWNAGETRKLRPLSCPSCSSYGLHLGAAPGNPEKATVACTHCGMSGPVTLDVSSAVEAWNRLPREGGEVAVQQLKKHKLKERAV